MLRTRQAFFEDFWVLDMDEASKKQLPTPPEGRGPIDECTTCYFRELHNVQAIYGIIWNGNRAELAMAISGWVRKHQSLAMARLARAEVPRMIQAAGYDDVWTRAPNGFDYVPRWLRYLGFEATGQPTDDGESEWWRWAQ